MVAAVMAAGAQVVGAAVVCVAVGVLAGLWWGVLLAGVLMAVGGLIAEAAERELVPRTVSDDPRPAPAGPGSISPSPDGAR